MMAEEICKRCGRLSESSFVQSQVTETNQKLQNDGKEVQYHPLYRLNMSQGGIDYDLH